MQKLSLVLKALSPIFFFVGALHLIMGLKAEVLLGAQIGPDVISNTVLDSQNRFYGVAFVIYGVLLYLCATNLSKYATVLHCLLWVFFAAGLARLVSIATYGLPTVPILALASAEIIVPPLLALWLARVEVSAGT